MNAYHQAMHFELPSCTPGWLAVINTALPAGDDLPSQPQPWYGPSSVVDSRSLVLLAAAPLLEGVSL
jgi:glycogen operon protein